MPIYEYRCENGHIFEEFQKVKDKPLEKCRVCTASVKKLFSRFSTQRMWNGSGIYSFDRAGRSPDWNR